MDRLLTDDEKDNFIEYITDIHRTGLAMRRDIEGMIKAQDAKTARILNQQ